ncbi:MAG: DNA-binding MarR family transcriptional regulator [Paraglaciecola psychrophila]|jgi:DNA-binding MarR family transcriptional regulator
MDSMTLTAAIFRELGIIQERVDAILKARLHADLPTSQFKLLNHLIFTTNTDETASEIAHNFHVSLSAMSQIIKQLRQKGFVDVHPRKQDTRKKNLFITDLGRSAHQQAIADIDIDISGFSEKFSLTELQQLYALNKQFRLSFEEHV